MFIASFSQGLAFGLSGERLAIRLRSMLFAAVLHQDIEFFDEESNTVGSLTSGLSLYPTQVNGLAGITFGTLVQVSTTILSVAIVSLVVGWKLALVCLACVPLLVGSGRLRMKMMRGFH